VKYTDDSGLPEIGDEKFLEVRQASRPRTIVILRAGPNFRMPGPDGDPEVTGIIMEHGRRNVALHVAGLMPIVCPIVDGSGVTGVGVFDASPEDVERIMSEDPGVKAGVFTFDVHAGRCLSSILPASDTAAR
jgi:hypothetical protein